MKYRGYLAFFVIIFLSVACHKDSTIVKPTSKTQATLPGKWKVVGNMISSGGPMYFVAASGNDYATFNTDGTLSGTAFPNYKYFTVQDTVKIRMASADQATYEDYFYAIKHDTLTLGMAGPYICIEGCAVVLVKQ
ncbi:MAG: hypothetical protein ACHQHN_03885 [Sphingobacteriales bacterium]